MLKFLTLAIAGILTVAVVKRVIDGLAAAKARVGVKRAEEPRAITPLRQDPRTGVYYPDA